MIIPYHCIECNKEFLTDTRELKRGNGEFCSRQCSTDHRVRNIKPPEPNSKCSFCQADIYVKPSRIRKSKSGIFYCNREHQREGSKAGIHKPGPKTDGKDKVCIRSSVRECNTKTEREDGVCKRCEIKDRIEAWLSGDISVTWVGSSREPNQFVKRHLLETRGDRCEECGYSKKRPDGSSKIQMDHIDGDYTNNRIDNLKLLCPNCHEDTPTFGSRNRGGGRRYRLAQSVGK